MKPVVRPTSKRGAREMSGADQLDAARRELGMALVVLHLAHQQRQRRTAPPHHLSGKRS
jgi:hypothetical protein